MKYYFKYIFLSIIFTLMIYSANASTYVVCPNDCDFSSIQAAIDDVNTIDGDTIEVQSGIYYENVVVNKQLILQGVDSGSGPIIINAMKLGASMILISGSNIIEGFTFINSSISDFPNNTGILVLSNDNIIKNNHAQGNEYDIFLYNSRNNTVKNNDASFTILHGIRLQNSNDNKIINNYGIYNHMAILLYNSSNNVIQNNELKHNDIGIYLLISNNNILEGNKAANGDRGAHLSSFSNYNILRGNTFTNNYYSMGFTNFNGIGNIIYNNYFNNAGDIYPVNNIKWNTKKKKTADTNIVGGPKLGGNFWANPSGTGFSQTCLDKNRDGICDLQYIIDTENIDYLPLSMNFKT